MAYAKADTTPKVGFRPYGQTNPAGASQLSGTGAYYLNRPFDPWELYPNVKQTDGRAGLGDLGQNHPFKTQAWHLEGLGQDNLALGGPSTLEQATTELVNAGTLTADQGMAILEGIANFSDYGIPDPTDQGSWSGLTSLFQTANHDLSALEAAYAGAFGTPGSPQALSLAGNPEFIALGQQLQANRQKYANLASQFTYYYTLLTGNSPSGLSGLGIAMVVYWVAGAAVFLVGAYLTLKAIEAWTASQNPAALQAKAQITTAQTNAALQAQLATAQKSGDTTTANTIANLLQQGLSTAQKQAEAMPPANPSPNLAWLEQNAIWIGLGFVAVMFVIPAGRRRR